MVGQVISIRGHRALLVTVSHEHKLQYHIKINNNRNKSNLYKIIAVTRVNNSNLKPTLTFTVTIIMHN